MRKFCTHILSIAFALVVSFAPPLLASTVIYRTDAQLIALSERVVRAQVVAQRTTRGGADGLTIYTVTTLAVLEDFTGQAGDTLEVWELGGVVGDEMLYVGGAVTYTVGREVLVCLERGPYGYRSIAMGFSKFDLATSSRGVAQLTRNLRDTVIVGGRVPASERTFDEFRSLAARVTGRPSRRAVAAAAVEVSAEDPFTLFQGGWRWVQADARTPIPWYKNTTAAAPIAGTAVSEIQIALAAWTNPPSAYITLAYAGTTSQATPRGPWSGIPDGNGVITFEDPNNEIPAGVLAIGGGSANGTPGSGGTIGGIAFRAFTRGFVIFQNVAELPVEFTTSLGFSRVLQHEIGHGIGLGHTDDDFVVLNPEANIMNSACCYPETPVPPAIGPDDLAGLNFIYPSNPTGPQMALDKATLRFGAVTNGASFLSQTSAQIVRLTQSAAGTVTWTASSDQPWLQVSPASGSGSANLSISVIAAGGLPVGASVTGAISFVMTGASNTPGPIAVSLTLLANGTSASPIVNLDSPIDNRTGVTGSVPFTGWAVDDIEVTQVSVCRAAFGAEVAPVDPNCGGTAQIFIGQAVFVEGARPDVAAAYATYPASTQAGWGLMVLTNMLPNQGNGTYVFSMWARDREGHTVLMGTRTMTCANASATLPFGAIDTPTQGGVASGATYVNFGWALTPQPKMIPIDGSTIQVVVDGAVVGTVNYNNFRSDIATLFPGLNNTNGAVGLRVLDTTALTNGRHTVAWVVTDNLGAAEGIGSRFFTVSNGAGALTAASAAEAQTHARRTWVARQALNSRVDRNREPLVGRRGWDLAAPLRAFEPDASGRVVVRSEEVNRVELQLGPGRHEGYLRAADGLAPLPIGSHLDASAGVFTWAPGVGYVGAYDFVFVRSHGSETASRRDVRIILAPKGSGAVGPQVVLDIPRPQQDVAQPFVLAGWAADLSAAQGTGVATLHAWAYPLTGGPPVFLGATAYGGMRPDVAAVHGDEFEASGFGLVVQGLTPGNYDLAVFAWSTERAGFAPAGTVRVTIR